MKKLIVLSLVIVFVAALVFAAFPVQAGDAAVAAAACPRVGWNSRAISGCKGTAIYFPAFPVKVTPLVGWNS